MNTTIDMAEQLYQAAMKRAEDGDRTFSDMVESALRVYLRHSLSFELWWQTTRGEGMPGIDFTSRDSLYGFSGDDANSDCHQCTGVRAS